MAVIGLSTGVSISLGVGVGICLDVRFGVDRNVMHYFIWRLAIRHRYPCQKWFLDDLEEAIIELTEGTRCPSNCSGCQMGHS